MLSTQFLVPLVLAADDVSAVRGTPTEWAITSIVGVLILVGLIVVAYTTKAGIIARATTKEAVRQPVFLLCMALAIVVLLVNSVLPFFSLGEDVKMLKDCSLATILISGLLIAVWTASTSVAEEIEGKTAMTLLSKPINRRQFVLGSISGFCRRCCGTCCRSWPSFCISSTSKWRMTPRKAARKSLSTPFGWPK